MPHEMESDSSEPRHPLPLPAAVAPVASYGMDVKALLDDWLADESGYDEQTWPELKASLDRDRPSSRRLFFNAIASGQD